MGSAGSRADSLPGEAYIEQTAVVGLQAEIAPSEYFVQLVGIHADLTRGYNLTGLHQIAVKFIVYPADPPGLVEQLAASTQSTKISH
jgi:hypothetical protein